MRTLKYAVLGLLNIKSMTGYELAKEFEVAIGEFWHAKHSQIYPELKKLADEGMITFEVEISGNVLEKKVYTITDAGREDLLKWIVEDEEIGVTPKDVFRLRLFFSDMIPNEKRLIMLKNHLARHRARLAHLQNNFTKFEVIPNNGDEGFADYLVIMSALMREEMTIDWLERCIDLCK